MSLILWAGCSVDLPEVECTRTDQCRASLGEVCRAGRCVIASGDGGGLSDAGDTGDGEDEAADSTGDASSDGEVGSCPDEPVCLDEERLLSCQEDASRMVSCSPEACCAGGCVDTDVSLAHCGGCGAVCLEANATAECVRGECRLSCHDDFFDLDREGDNGCECGRLDPGAGCPTCEGECRVANHAIFVDADQEGIGTGTVDDPFASLVDALDAIDAEHPVILVADDEYDLAGATLEIDADHGEVWIIGGLDPDRQWSRVEEPATSIVGATPVIRVDSAALHLGYLEIDAAEGRAASGPGEAGENSIAVHAIGAEVTLDHVSVAAGRGGNGRSGEDGKDGDDRGTASGGQPGQDRIVVCVPEDTRDCTESVLLGGAGAEQVSCDGTPQPGSQGGDGGAGSFAEDPAQDGEDGGDGVGGRGGNASGVRSGGAGGLGLRGFDGVGGGPLGYVRDHDWHPVPGSDGTDGGPGRGGGGGAGREAGDVLFAGASGGGGGSGGCGGTAGRGGGGGGGSFGLLLIESNVALYDSDIVGGQAGSGGNGGTGGLAGSAGSGGEGGIHSTEGAVSRAGDGGNGGAGGRGGHGGGGGPGLSAAVLLVDSLLEGERYTLSAGRAGSPGRGGLDDVDDPYNNGWPGLADDELDLFSGDADLAGDCPRGMVELEESWCIDRVEASRPFATDEASVGDRDGFEIAQSLAELSVLPWNRVNFLDAAVACLRAGKVLCTDEQLVGACDGELDWSYPYGNVYEERNCNDESAPTTGLAPTGTFAACTTPTGVLDLTGNVAEWAAPADLEDLTLFSLVHAIGGHFTSTASAATCDAAESHGLEAAWLEEPTIGFRCCSAVGAADEREFREPSD